MEADELEEMKKVDIRTVDISTLVDIGEIKINRELPKKERMLSFINEVKTLFVLYVMEWWSKHLILIQMRALRINLQGCVLRWQENDEI